MIAFVPAFQEFFPFFRGEGFHLSLLNSGISISLEKESERWRKESAQNFSLSLSLSSLAFFPRRIYSKPLCFYRVNASRKSAFLFFPNEQKSTREVLGFYYLFPKVPNVLLLGEKIFTERRERERLKKTRPVFMTDATTTTTTRGRKEEKRRRRRRGALFSSSLSELLCSFFFVAIFIVSVFGLFFLSSSEAGKGGKRGQKNKKNTNEGKTADSVSLSLSLSLSLISYPALRAEFRVIFRSRFMRVDVCTRASSNE
jgi:hypothetical protein